MTFQVPDEFRDPGKLTFDSYAKDLINKGGVTYGVEEKQILIPHEDDSEAIRVLTNMAISDLSDYIPAISKRRGCYKFTRERDDFYYIIKVRYQTYKTT